MRYVRSTTTGAVLPYNKILAKMSNIQVLTDEECDAHDELHRSKDAKPVVKKATKKKVVKKKDEKKATKKSSFSVSSSKDDIDEVVAALAID